jgi:pyruvate kinase
MLKHSTETKGHLSVESAGLRPKTRIICTIGPKTNSVEKLEQLLDAGMSCVRLNTAHGDFDFHQSIIDNTREACQRKNTLCAIMVDIKGPEIRTMKLQPNPARDNRKEWSLEAGAEFTFTTDKTHVGCNKKIATSYEKLAVVVKPGSRILVADGLIAFQVVSTNGVDEVTCVIENSGTIGENKNMNLPGHVVDLPAVTEKDKLFVEFAVKNDIDFIAGSFIRKAQDILDIRALPGVAKHNINIIAKIESQEGLDNFDEILAVTDAVMVARGDLGVEIPLAQVTSAQKDMISRCNKMGIPVITATQMLESMIMNPRPTRAEVADVYNAVSDGTDSVMLSGETANGSYPIEAVQIMASVCLEAESSINHRELFLKLREVGTKKPELNVAESVSSSAVKTSWDLQASLIVALSKSGKTARLVSKYRPHCPILAITCERRVASTLLITRGVNPYLVEEISGVEVTAEKGIHRAVEAGLLDNGDFVIVTSGAHGSVSGTTSMMRVAQINNHSTNYIL